MLTEQQEEKIQELASAFKKLADISNDDYFYKLTLFPDCQIVLSIHWNLKKIRKNC